MNVTPEQIIKTLSSKRFINLHNEKKLQIEIDECLKANGLEMEREYTEDDINIFDFFHSGIVLEVKLKTSSKRSIYKQCVRYASLEWCKQIILVTLNTMGFPKEINGKPCYLIKLAKAWL